MTTVRLAAEDDRDELFSLASDFATSFQVQRTGFDAVFEQVRDNESIWLGVADGETGVIGYLLGLDHPTFYANGRVAWVEEIMVREDYRRQGVGRCLMDAFENWTVSRGTKLIALSTRRAASFYKAIGYEESATYFRKLVEP